MLLYLHIKVPYEVGFSSRFYAFLAGKRGGGACAERVIVKLIRITYG